MSTIRCGPPRWRESVTGWLALIVAIIAKCASWMAHGRGLEASMCLPCIAEALWGFLRGGIPAYASREGRSAFFVMLLIAPGIPATGARVEKALPGWCGSIRGEAREGAVLRTFCKRVAAARTRVWLTTPYFVPSHRLVRALEQAATSGADVKLLFPERSDVPVITSVAAEYYERLLPAGVSIFHYQPAILHAKTMIIDDWATVGSSNLNHRSLFHDFEVDLVLTKQSSVRETRASFYGRCGAFGAHRRQGV